MKHLKTYTLFESHESILSRLEDCFRDLEDIGLSIEYGVEEGLLLVFIQKKTYNGSDPYSNQDEFILKDIIETIEFANSYSSSELGLVLDGINFTYYNGEHLEDMQDTSRRYARDMDHMIKFLGGTDKKIFDIQLAYKKMK